MEENGFNSWDIERIPNDAIANDECIERTYLTGDALEKRNRRLAKKFAALSLRAHYFDNDEKKAHAHAECFKDQLEFIEVFQAAQASSMKDLEILASSDHIEEQGLVDLSGVEVEKMLSVAPAASDWWATPREQTWQRIPETISKGSPPSPEFLSRVLERGDADSDALDELVKAYKAPTPEQAAARLAAHHQAVSEHAEACLAAKRRLVKEYWETEEWSQAIACLEAAASSSCKGIRTGKRTFTNHPAILSHAQPYGNMSMD